MTHKATDYAAFRWYANTLENKALEIYTGNPDTLMSIRKVLEAAILELDKVRTKLGDKDKICYRCPWLCCPDDACSPMCGRAKVKLDPEELLRQIDERLERGPEPWRE